jgi:hypothetical protein
MLNFLKLVLPVLGVIVIIFQLIHIGDDYRGVDSSFWGFLLGFGLIVSPFTALIMLIGYLLMIGIFFGSGILGALICVELFGRGGWAIIGFCIGCWGGLKFVCSDLFDKLLKPLRILEEAAKK